VLFWKLLLFKSKKAEGQDGKIAAAELPRGRIRKHPLRH